MANILPRDLPAAGTVNPASALIIDDGSGVKKATPAEVVDSGAPVNSQVEAEAGVVNTGRMTPLRVKQAIDALGVSQVVLASTEGANMVGTPTGTVQDDIDARPTTSALAAPTGGGMVGNSVGGSIQQVISAMPLSALTFGAVSDDLTDNTANIQTAIDTVSPFGGTVAIPPGCKFDLRSLVFPGRTNLQYRIDDDTSTGTPSVGLASSEMVNFSANSSYPLDPTGAAVNEWRYTAAFHPGKILDVRKDIAGADDGLAPGQSRFNPVRASYNIADEQVNTFRIIYENYQNFDTFSGVAIHAWRRRYVLSGVGTSGWSVSPLINARVRGTTSGARGFVKAIDAGTLTIEWFSGAFVTGETVTNETVAAVSTGTITGPPAFSEAAMAPIAQDLWKGAWTIGDRPPAVGTELINVSGNVKLVPTRGSSFVQPKTVTKPTLKFGENPELGSPHEMGIQYDPALSQKRLAIVDTTAETWRGQLVPVSAACTFTHSTTVNTNSVNIATITLNSTGVYIFTFTNGLARTGVMTLAEIDGFSGTSVVGWKAQVTSRATTGCTVEIRDSANALADIPAGAWASLMVLGGDV